MEINQSEEVKTEGNTKSVSIEINEEKYKEKINSNENDVSQYKLADYIITIKKLPLLNIKYFKFGQTIHFYFFPLKKAQYKLSEIPTPLFTLGPECKFKKYFHIRLQFYLLYNFYNYFCNRIKFTSMFFFRKRNENNCFIL